MHRTVLVLGAFVVIVISGSSVSAAEQIRLEVREAAGIRRFGYPVAAELKLVEPMPATTRFRLLEKDKPVAAQFRPIALEGDHVAAVALDFDASYMPGESRDYIVEYGPDVPAGPEPDRGLKIAE